LVDDALDGSIERAGAEPDLTVGVTVRLRLRLANERTVGAQGQRRGEPQYWTQIRSDARVEWRLRCSGSRALGTCKAAWRQSRYVRAGLKACPCRSRKIRIFRYPYRGYCAAKMRIAATTGAVREQTAGMSAPLGTAG
jgi:hypothetical protein